MKRVQYTGIEGVKWDGAQGYDNPERFLEEGSVYDVCDYSVGGWTSYIVLNEFPHQRFNSLCFDAHQQPMMYSDTDRAFEAQVDNLDAESTEVEDDPDIVQIGTSPFGFPEFISLRDVWLDIVKTSIRGGNGGSQACIDADVVIKNFKKEFVEPSTDE